MTCLGCGARMTRGTLTVPWVVMLGPDGSWYHWCSSCFDLEDVAEELRRDVEHGGTTFLLWAERTLPGIRRARLELELDVAQEEELASV